VRCFAFAAQSFSCLERSPAENLFPAQKADILLPNRFFVITFVAEENKDMDANVSALV
jgi:hypothetical protein